MFAASCLLFDEVEDEVESSLCSITTICVVLVLLISLKGP